MPASPKVNQRQIPSHRKIIKTFIWQQSFSSALTREKANSYKEKKWTKTPIDLLRQKSYNWLGFILKNDTTAKQQYIVQNRLTEKRCNQRTHEDIRFLSMLFYKIWQWLNGNFVPTSWFSQISNNCWVITREDRLAVAQCSWPWRPALTIERFTTVSLALWPWQKMSMRDDCQLV